MSVIRDPEATPPSTKSVDSIGYTLIFEAAVTQAAHPSLLLSRQDDFILGAKYVPDMAGAEHRLMALS